MNDRIKELAEQATVIRKTFHGIEHIEFDKEKFAELIVKECIEIVDSGYLIGPGNQIRKHFGVEE